MAAPTYIPLANSPTLKRSFTAVTRSREPSPDTRVSSKEFKVPALSARPQADQRLPFFQKRRQASDYLLPNMPVAAGPQAYQSQFPSFMSVYGLDQSSMDSRVDIATVSKLGTPTEDISRPSPESENASPTASLQHKHRDSTSTQCSESTDSSPTETISTADSSSLTDPSPSSSPESPVTIVPLSSFSATTFGIHSLDDLTMSEHVNHDHLQPFGYDRPMTSPSPRKPRNAKGLALKLSPIGDTLQQTQAPLISSIASPTFVKPPPPKPRKKPSLLSLQTPANPAPNPLPRLFVEPPPTPGVTRPTTLKHYHSSPHILFSPDPRGGPAGGMQLPNFERSRISGLSSAFRKPSALVESTSMGPGSTIEEEDIPIRTQMATRSTADIGGDPFDAPPSQEEAQSPGYPDGPIAIYEPYVYLYLEPTAEEASKFDVVINVASEVKNPFKAAQISKESEEVVAPKTTFDLMDLDRENIPVPDTAASIATFKTAFEWQPDQQTPTESSPTTPKPMLKLEPEYIHVPWEHNTDISKELMGLCEVIDNRTKEGKKVLVHCQQGASRSASLIIAYGLYKDPSLTVNDAYHAAQAKSKWISPNMKLMYALQDFQKEVEKKKLLSAAGHKRGGGRSPTKHRTTLSADAVGFSPKDPPLTAPLPDRDGNSPAGNTPLRLRGNSTPNFGEVSPGPSSAPSSFAWTPKAENAPALWGSFPPELSEPQSAVTQTNFGFSQSTFGFGQSGVSEASSRSLNHVGFGSFPQTSYDTPPDSGFSSQSNQQQAISFNAFPSLSAAGHQQQDIGLTLQNIATFPTQFAARAIDDTPPTPSLWSPRVQEFTANPLRQSFAPIRPLDNGPPSPALMSPRVTEFVNPFRPAPTTNFSRPLNARPAVLRPVVDPRSPAMKGEAPIIRSIDDVL